MIELRTWIKSLISFPGGETKNFNRLIEYLIHSPLTFCQNKNMRFEIKLFEKWIRKGQFFLETNSKIGNTMRWNFEKLFKAMRSRKVLAGIYSVGVTSVAAAVVTMVIYLNNQQSMTGFLVWDSNFE